MASIHFILAYLDFIGKFAIKKKVNKSFRQFQLSISKYLKVNNTLISHKNVCTLYILIPSNTHLSG